MKKIQDIINSHSKAGLSSGHVRNVMALNLIAAVSLLAGACSYGMDMLEGAITERASFSINASYSTSTDTLSVSWDETGSGSDFAGFEVYMTTDAWDEYGDYTVIAARINLSDTSFPSSWITFNSSLDPYDSSANITVHSPPEEGEYYVRVGMIKFDEIEDSDPKAYYGVADYDDHSYVDRISGYETVYIY